MLDFPIPIIEHALLMLYSPLDIISFAIAFLTQGFKAFFL
jgi:hypothetical protein